MEEMMSGHSHGMADGQNTYQYARLPSSRHIRLLSLLPGDEASPLSCRLEAFSLDSTPKFESLSYAWGTLDSSQELYVKGNVSGKLMISSTLGVALRCICSGYTERWLWVDAICINQLDLEERNAQIPLMRSIYTNAERVVIWLGEASSDSDCAMDFLKRMGMEKKRMLRGHWRGSERLGSDTSSECGDGNPVPEMEENRDQVAEELEESFTDNDGEEDSSSQRYADDDSEADINRKHSRRSTFSVRHLLGRVYSTIMQQIDRFKWYLRSEWYELKGKIGWWWKGQTVWEETFAQIDINRKRVGHIQFGIPVLYDMFGNDLDMFFDDKYAKDWAALDSLLARQWWSRTWIVQEAWSASGNSLLQCGTKTIKWKTFQKAMDYEEAWDDFGGLIKDTARGEHWMSLKRRYSLAIHISKRRLLDSTLSDLLWNTWDREVTDPRDKVFAILGLVGKGQEDLTRPDYMKPWQQVYRETARDIIVNERSLDILLAANGLDRNDGLPSWVPDWRKEANEKRPTLFINRQRIFTLYFSGSMDGVWVNGHGFSASDDQPASFNFDASLTTVHVKGIFVDHVKIVGQRFQDSAPSSEVLEDAFALVTSQSRPWFTSTKQLRQQVQDILVAGSAGYQPVEDVTENNMRHRSFFITEKGYRCIGPSNVKEGDSIYIIAGCNFPILLRREQDLFGLVGEAYVEGVMKGEIVNRAKKSFFGRNRVIQWEDIVIG